MKEKSKILIIKQQISSERLITIPNVISLLRILILPFFVYFGKELSIHPYSIKTFLITVILLTIIYLSDYFDGYVARKLNKESLFGKYLDPVCDKIFTVVSLSLLVLYFKFPTIFLIIIFIRELFGVYIGYFLFFKRGFMGSPNRWGKWGVILVGINLFWYICIPSLSIFFPLKLNFYIIHLPGFILIFNYVGGMIEYAITYFPYFKIKES